MLAPTPSVEEEPKATTVIGRPARSAERLAGKGTASTGAGGQSAAAARAVVACAAADAGAAPASSAARSTGTVFIAVPI